MCRLNPMTFERSSPTFQLTIDSLRLFRQSSRMTLYLLPPKELPILILWSSALDWSARFGSLIFPSSLQHDQIVPAWRLEPFFQ